MKEAESEKYNSLQKHVTEYQKAGENFMASSMIHDVNTMVYAGKRQSRYTRKGSREGTEELVQESNRYS